MLLRRQLMLWAGRAFCLGRYTETQRTNAHRSTQNLIIVHILRGKTLFLFICRACESKCEGRCKSKPRHWLKRRRMLNDAVSACQAESDRRHFVAGACKCHAFTHLVAFGRRKFSTRRAEERHSPAWLAVFPVRQCFVQKRSWQHTEETFTGKREGPDVESWILEELTSFS